MRIIAILFFIFLFCIAKTNGQPAYWQEITAYKQQDKIQSPPQHAILFIGSSSFRMWKDVQQTFPEYSIINRGFGGAILPDVIRYFYDIILPYHPKQILIYCGENDLALPDSIPVAAVVKRFKTLFAMIRINLPGTRIDFVSIKPSPVRASIQLKVRQANERIEQYIRTKKNAGYIDIYTPMLDASGNMRAVLYLSDRLHMNEEGYRIWAEKIRPFLLRN